MTRGRLCFSKTIRLFLITFTMMTSSFVFANSLSSVFSCCSTLHPIIAIASGVAITSDVGKSKTFPIINPISDQYFIYHARKSSQRAGLFDVFIGAESALRPDWALQLGLAYDREGDLDAKGSLTQGVDVGSQDQFTYHYNVFAQQFLVVGKLLYNFKCLYHPYFLLGLGASRNRADDYTTNVPPFLTFTRVYNAHTNTSFSYDVGFGMDVDVLKHVRFGIGYRFTDFGKVTLGSGKIDTTAVSGTLSQSQLYANEVFGQITFVI